MLDDLIKSKIKEILESYTLNLQANEIDTNIIQVSLENVIFYCKLPFSVYVDETDNIHIT